MKPKFWLLLAGLILLIAAGVMVWIGSKPAPKKVILAKKKGIVARAVRVKDKVKSLPEIIRKYKQPKVAIVIDDFGYNMNNIEDLLEIDELVTLSILPDLPYSSEIAELAVDNKREVILHLPLESHRKDVKEEYDTIRSGMTEKEVVSRLDKQIKSIPGLKGVSNHMGSKSTEDRELMTTILKYLKSRNLYFLDSMTSQKSVCRDVAGAMGQRCAKRDIFLDNSTDPKEIEKQILALRKLAFKKGKVVAICHDRDNTIEVLAKMLPVLEDDGIRFVTLSELMRK